MWRTRESAEVREEKQIQKEEKAEKKKKEKKKKDQRRGERRLRKQENKIKKKPDTIEENSEAISYALQDNPLLRQKKLICFDLYGTLIFRPHSHWKTKQFLKHVWIKPFKKYYEVIQTHKKEDVESAYESVHGFKMPKRALHAMQKHTDEEVKNTKLYPETLAVLKKLKNSWYKLALISNLSQDFETPLRKLIPNWIFDYEALSYDVWVTKPDTKIFEKILDDANKEKKETNESSKLTASDSIMIWDSTRSDVWWAKNVWMDAILINRKSENLNYNAEKQLITIHVLTDLLDILWIDY